MLRKALDSVAAQTYADWEAIVFDVAASEEARSVASQYDSRVKYFAGVLEGPSYARNRGFSESCGEYILFLDDDDELLPGSLSVLVGQLKSDPTAGVSYGWYAWITPQGHITSAPGPRIDNVDPQALPDGRLLAPCGFLHEGEVLSHLIREETLLLGDALIRRSWVTEVTAGKETWPMLSWAYTEMRYSPDTPAKPP